MSNTIDKYIIITFFIVNNPYSCHPYMCITENYSSKFMMSFWAPALKSPNENGIPKKSLNTSVITQQKICYNWEHAHEEILANYYVSIFNSCDFFI